MLGLRKNGGFFSSETDFFCETKTVRCSHKTNQKPKKQTFFSPWTQISVFFQSKKIARTFLSPSMDSLFILLWYQPIEHAQKNSSTVRQLLVLFAFDSLVRMNSFNKMIHYFSYVLDRVLLPCMPLCQSGEDLSIVSFLFFQFLAFFTLFFFLQLEFSNRTQAWELNKL